MNTKSFIAAIVMAAAIFSAPALQAAEEGEVHIEKQSWSFGGVFGTYDENQLQRGFQIFREVCASCHGARLLAFRNLAEDGGPGFSEAQVRALAAEYQIVDETTADGIRPGVAADQWPSPFASEQDARDANGGAYPPDFSVLAKARGVHDPFPFWAFNYFTGYQEGGADYIYNLLLGYHEEPPEGVELAPGQYYNEVYPGHAISMAPPLADGLVDYADPEEGVAGAEETLEQYARDVSAFMMWVAEPHLASRKETGFRVLLFLVVFAGLMYFTKRKLWKGIEH
jgi:ubiquinol-cytochrome c reductase cytochrome c1 subunit